MAFQILSGKGWKHGQRPAAPVHRGMTAFKVWQQIVQNPWRKTSYGLCKSCRE
jgi:hypothetical protein